MNNMSPEQMQANLNMMNPDMMKKRIEYVSRNE